MGSRIITEYFKILIENDRIPIIIILDFFFGDFWEKFLRMYKEQFILLQSVKLLIIW